jgi:glycosyltransferase involved in cell wall biosynthesis
VDKSPTVTVCIPTYNRSSLLLTSLQSVLRQAFRDLEVIVSDNASTDDTQDVVRSFDDPRVKYERLPENIGLFGNLSRCLQLGSGRYRVVLPDDDLMLPGNIERKVAFLDSHPSAGMVHSGFRFLDDDGEPAGPIRNWARLSEDTLEPGPAFIHRSLALGGLVCVSSVMLRSSLVEQEKFDADDGPYADMALWLRVASRGDVGFLPDALSGLRVHSSSASSAFRTVVVKGERHVLTTHHADALRRAHGRFVANAELDPGTRRELGQTLSNADRRLRMSIFVNGHLPPAVVRTAKRAMGWQPGGRLHRLLSLDGAYSPPPPLDRAPNSP